jgi:signal transduction histidine kinase
LHAVATAATGRFSTLARQRGVGLAVEVDPGTVIETDAELLALILQNLIGNAVKYSVSGTVRIGCDFNFPHAESSSRSPVLWVSDEGPGIGAQMAGKIFDAFQRGEGHAEDGIGLGLTIASEAAKLLNARLTVDSQPGSGSTFRLALYNPGGQSLSTGITQEHEQRNHRDVLR